MKYMILLLLVSNSFAADLVTKSSPKNLIKSCDDVTVDGRVNFCSKTIKQQKPSDVYLELSESLIERLDDKKLQYDIIRISNEAILTKCLNDENLVEQKICIDPEKVQTYKDKNTALLVEDLF